MVDRAPIASRAGGRAVAPAGGRGGRRRAAPAPGSVGAASALGGARRPTDGTGWCSSTTARGRWSRPRSSSRRRRGRPRTARRSRSCRWPRPSSGSTATASRRPSIGPGWGRRRPRRASGGASCARPSGSPRKGQRTWTDEAALLEACRIAVHVVPGDPANLKVTVPADLARVARRCSPEPARSDGPGSGMTRIRSGRASRCASAASRSPALPGSMATPMATSCCMRSPTRCSGLPHWAISGGCSRRMPRRRAAIDSGELLAEVVARLAGAGWRPAGVDLTIVGARPRLGGAPRRDARRDRRRLSASTRRAVSVKASTGNLDGSEGAGRSISALALATIEAASMSGSGCTTR